MTNRHVKRFLASLIIREIQMKTTMRYCFTLVRMAIIKISATANDGEDVEKGESSFMVVGNVN